MTEKKPDSLKIMKSPDELNEKNSDDRQNKTIDLVELMLSKVKKITSPDDLDVAMLASDIKSQFDEDVDLRNFVAELCDMALSCSESTSVIGAIFGQMSNHQVGECKVRNLLFCRLQKEYVARKEVKEVDRSRFICTSMFLGEVFYFVKTDQGKSFKVLADPVVVFLSEVLQPHMSLDPGQDINEEMMVVAKQLLINGSALCECVPDKVQSLLRDVTEVLVRHSLNQAVKLNLLAALSETWPLLNQSTKARTLHAFLAAKMGLVLKV